MAVISLTADRSGNVWIGTLEGLFYLNRDAVFVRAVHGTEYTPITAIVEDDQPVSWIATMADGLKQLADGIVRIFNKQAELSGNRIKVLFEDTEGILWLGSERSGLISVDHGKITPITTEQGLSSNNITSIFQENKRVFWVGTNSGLNRFNPGRNFINKNDISLSEQYIRM